MPEDSELPLLAASHNGEHHKSPLAKTFSWPVACYIAALVALFSVFVKYDVIYATDAHVHQYYMFYIHVAIMIFVGFGFLMTFLRNYSFSAVGLNFFESCLVILSAIVFVGGAQQIVFGPAKWGSSILLDLPLLIDANFAAGAAMISFGALLGKTTPPQLTLLLLLEVPIYALNTHFVADTFKALDIGGSVSIHAFGAYFGLAASLVLSKTGTGSEHLKNCSTYTSDITAMIGTLFLWIFWPSFNGALASDPLKPHSTALFLCVVNTVLSLLGACVVTFAASGALQGEFNMVHVQNATLAGGVAVGSAANMMLGPGGALSIGVVAGLLSTLGYVYVTPLLESKIQLRDTCGVHNLHGMPGILGGVAAALAALKSSNSHLIGYTHGSTAALYQLLALGVTLLVASLGGAAAAYIVKLVEPSGKDFPASEMFDDSKFWEGDELIERSG